MPKTLCYENIKYQQNGTILRNCLTARKNNGTNFLPDSSSKNWVDKRFLARHKKIVTIWQENNKFAETMKTFLHPWQKKKRSKGYSFAENDNLVVKNLKWQHNCQMQTVDENFHRHVTAKRENVEGNFHRHFSVACKKPMVIVSDILHPELSKMWMEFLPTLCN